MSTNSEVVDVYVVNYESGGTTPLLRTFKREEAVSFAETWNECESTENAVVLTASATIEFTQPVLAAAF